MRTWRLRDARRRFGEVVDKALDDGPQRVTRHGRQAVVIVAEDEWQRLQSAKPAFGALLASFPGVGSDLPPRRPARAFGKGV